MAANSQHSVISCVISVRRVVLRANLPVPNVERNLHELQHETGTWLMRSASKEEILKTIALLNILQLMIDEAFLNIKGVIDGSC